MDAVEMTGIIPPRIAAAATANGWAAENLDCSWPILRRGRDYVRLEIRYTFAAEAWQGTPRLAHASTPTGHNLPTGAAVVEYLSRPERTRKD